MILALSANHSEPPVIVSTTNEPCHEKTCLRDFQPSLTQTMAAGLKFRKKRDCTIHVAIPHS